MLAPRLAIRFIDLDQAFTTAFGDISAYLDANGYAAYAAYNESRVVVVASFISALPPSPHLHALARAHP